MSTSRSLLFLALLLCATVVGCDKRPTSNFGDAGADAGTDAGADAGTDAGADASAI